MPDFQESQLVSDLMPWANYGYLGKLSIVKKGSLYNAGDISGLVALIADESKFWRMLLSKGDSLISKMVATSNMWRNTHLISELHHRGELSRDDYNQLRNSVAPLSQDSLDIGEAFDYELKFTIGAIKQKRGHESLLVQPRETISALERYYTAPLKCLSKLTSNDFSTFYHQRHSKPAPSTCGIRDAFESSETSSLVLYSDGEKDINLANSVVSTTDYIARVHDLDGMLELIRSRLFPEINVAHAEAQQPTSTLGFECLSPDSICRLPPK